MGASATKPITKKFIGVVIGAPGCTFAVTMDSGASVAELKNELKLMMKTRHQSVDANCLQLYLAKKHNSWLTEDDADAVTLEQLPGFAKMMNTYSLEDYFGVGFAPGTREIHLLLVVPKDESIDMQVSGNRKSRKVNSLFETEILSIPTRNPRSHEVDENFEVDEKHRRDGDCEDEEGRAMTYFRMKSFPPMAHAEEKYKTIAERKAYVAIFSELMGIAKMCFDTKSGANLMVTGNPGIGKSRFYLYCIFHLIFQRQDVVKGFHLSSLS